MKALVLSAGFGTRLSPLTDIVPKCLMPIRGIPLLHYWICDLLKAGVNDIFVNTHYMPDLIYKFINRQDYRDRVRCLYETKLLGTAGTLIENKTLFEGSEFIVAHADNYTDIKLDELKKFHKNFRSDIQFTLTTFQAQDPSQCGIVGVENCILKSFIEKPKEPISELANAAIYYFGDKFFESLEIRPDMKDISIDVIPTYNGEIKCFHHNGFNIDIGTRDSYELAQSDIFKKNYKIVELGSLSLNYEKLADLMKGSFENF